MATSGSIDFAVSRDDIINEALQLQGTIGDVDTTDANKIASMGRTLNMMVKHWQTKGLNLYTLQRTYLFVQKNTNEYNLGSANTRYAKNLGQRGSFQTTLSAGASSGATAVVTSDDLSSTLSTGDWVGVLTTDNTLSWSTISSIPGTTINLNTALSAAASSGAIVYYYLAANQGDRPMKILQGSRVTSGNTSIPMTMMTRQEFMELSAHGSDGTAINFYYDPQITNGVLHIWTQPSNEVEYLELWIQRTLEDFDASADNPDFPQEWYLTLAYNLAALTMPKQGVPATTKQEVRAMAKELLMEAEGFDVEEATYIEPETRYR